MGGKKNPDLLQQVKLMHEANTHIHQLTSKNQKTSHKIFKQQWRLTLLFPAVETT